MAKKKVYFDLGHEGVGRNLDPGAVANGLHEADVVLKIGKYINDMMENYENVEWKFSRLSDKRLSLSQRTNEANAWGADLLVSIHINAGGGDGFESYIYNGSYNGKGKTQAFQNTLHKNIMQNCKFFDDRGKKQANFHMCRESGMDAVLTENGFIDSNRDAAALKDRGKLIQIAAGHVEGIADFLGLKKKASAKPKPDPAPEGTFFRVITGSFADRENAEARMKALKKDGWDSFLDVYKK